MAIQYRIIFFLLLLLISSALYAQDPPGAVRFSSHMMHQSSITSVCFSPNSRYILSGGYNENLKLWEVNTGKEIRTFKGNDWTEDENINAVCISPNGKYALSIPRSGNLILWNLNTGQIVREFTIDAIGGRRATNPTACICFSPDSQYIISGSTQGEIKLWSVDTGLEVRTFSKTDGDITSICFSPNGHYALSGSDDKTLTLWNVKTGLKIRKFVKHKDVVESVCFSPDSRYVLSGSRDGTIKFWDVATAGEIRSLVAHKEGVNSVYFSPNGRYVLSGGNDNKLTLWDIQKGKKVRDFTGHTNSVVSVCISSDNRYALSGDHDGIIRLWDIDSGREIFGSGGHNKKVNTVSYSPDGQYVLSGSDDGTVKLWEVSTGREIRTFNGHKAPVNSVCFSLDSRYILSGDNDYKAKILVHEVFTGRLVQTFISDYYSNLVCFSPNGQYAFIAKKGFNDIEQWEVSTGRKIHTFHKPLEEGNGYEDHPPRNGVTSIIFNASGNYFLSGYYSSGTSLWDVNSVQEIKTFYKANSQQYTHVCFSPDGNYVLGINKHREPLKLWDVATGQEVRPFTGELSEITDEVCFSPDGRFALSDNYTSLILWEVNTGHQVKSFSHYPYGENVISFSPDGQLFLSQWADTLKLWNIKQNSVVQTWQLDYSIDHISFNSDGSAIQIGTDAYFANLPIQSRSPQNSTSSVFSQIIWRSNPATVHESAYSVQAAFVSNYANPIQASHIRVYINGQLQAAGQKMGITALKANQGRYNWQQILPLQKGDNEIVLGLLLPNQPEILSEPLTITYLPPTQPNLYVVTIGIPGQGLTYAGDDAEAIGQLLKQQQGKLFNRVITRFLNRPEQISTTNLRNEMSQLPLYDITPNDVLIIFASAHGKKINLRNKQTDFALQPKDYNSANISTEENTTLLYKGHILDNIESIACKKLILLDACHSGEAVLKQGGKSQYLRDLRDAQEIVKRTSPGLITLSSSNDGQFSWEDDTWKHGAFTKALLDGLAGAADSIDPITSRKDGFVFVSELFSYLQKTVPSLVSKVKKEEQQPQMYPQKLADSADFPIVQY